MRNPSRDKDAFWPPYCPNPDCTHAAQGQTSTRPGFFRHGYYVTRFGTKRVPRFLCRACRRTMSSQTFHVSYRLRRPDLEHAILREIAQGASLRRVAQVLGVNRKTVSRRLSRARRNESLACEGPGSGGDAMPSAR